MIAKTVVVDVSQDWLFACDVQERFMQTPCPAVKTLSYASRRRQLQALGGDCFDFLPLPGCQVGLVIAP